MAINLKKRQDEEIRNIVENYVMNHPEEAASGRSEGWEQTASEAARGWQGKGAPTFEQLQHKEAAQHICQLMGFQIQRGLRVLGHARHE